MKWIIFILITAVFVWYILPSIFTILGNRAYHDKSLTQALKWYRRAAKTGRMSPATRTAYGLLTLRDARPQEAERILTALILDKKIKPEKKLNARAYRAMAYVKQGRMEDACEEITELLENGKSSLTYSLAGYVLALVDTPNQELLRLCEEAYEYNSDERDIVDNLAVACMRCKDYTRAVELCKDLMEEFPEFLEGFYHGAMAYHALGDIPAAKECLSRIPDCRRSYMTTISEEDIAALTEKVNAVSE